MSVKLGYIVPDGLEVDHIDNDKTNDDIDNLQVLSSAENTAKEKARYLEEEQVSYGCCCAYCEVSFIITERVLKMKLSKGQELAFCSRSCSASYYSKIDKTIVRTIADDDMLKIKKLHQQGHSSYSISKQTGFSRNTVMKYW